MIKSKQLFRIQMNDLFLLHQIRKDPGKQLPNEESPTICFPCQVLGKEGWYTKSISRGKLNGSS